MAVPLEQLIAKATGTINALEAMSSKERDKHPYRSFAEDFNKFRAMALQTKPEIEEIAPATIQMSDMGMTLASYAEMLAYWQQMIQLLRS